MSPFLSGYILKNKVASARRDAGRARGGKSFLKKGPLPCIPLLSRKLFLWTVRDVPVADRNDITIVICKRRKSHVTICNGRTTAERACRPPLSSSSRAYPPFSLHLFPCLLFTPIPRQPPCLLLTPGVQGTCTALLPLPGHERSPATAGQRRRLTASPGQKFFGVGESTRGEGAVFTKNAPSPLVPLLPIPKNNGGPEGPP